MSPAFALSTLARGTRTFHPRGIVLEGEASPVALSPASRMLAQRLAGPVLVRFSAALWKKRELPDVLGCAIRFRSVSGPERLDAPGDQDLLLATIARLPLLAASLFTTRAHDYLDNNYYGIAPFAAEPLTRVKFRLRALSPSVPAEGREERIRRSLERGPVVLVLEARRAELRAAFEPLCRLELTNTLAVDHESLHFDPFRTGRNVVPRGFLHHTRVPVYRIGRRLRPPYTWS